MKVCPECGRNENTISMTTGLDENVAECSCGWKGKVADMKDDEPKLTDREKLEAAAKELGIDVIEGVTDDGLKAAIKAKKTTAALVEAAEKLGIEVKTEMTDDEIKALIKEAKK